MAQLTPATSTVCLVALPRAALGGGVGVGVAVGSVAGVASGAGVGVAAGGGFTGAAGDALAGEVGRGGVLGGAVSVPAAWRTAARNASADWGVATEPVKIDLKSTIRPLSSPVASPSCLIAVPLKAIPGNQTRVPP